MSSHCQEVAEQLQHAFLMHCDEMTPYELFFGIVLPFLLVFAIIHYAMTKMWGEDNQKEATLIALVLAMFPIPTGTYQMIGEALRKLGDVIRGEKLPEEGFEGVPIVEGIMQHASPVEQQAIVAVGIGALLAILIPFVGSKREAQELKKHEIAGIILISAVVWMSMQTGESANPTSNMLNVATFAGILVLGAAMLWAALKHGEGIKGWVAGIVGIAVVGWGLTKLPAGTDKWFPQVATDFGSTILSGLMWVGFVIFFVIVVLIVVVAHLGGS